MKIFFIIFLLISFSCKTIIKTIYGVHKPQVERIETLNPYLYSLGALDTMYSFFCKDTTSLYKVFKISGGMPDIIAFNAKGNSVSYKINQDQCNAKVSEFLLMSDRLDFADSLFSSDTLLFLKNFLDLIQPVHANNLLISGNKPVVFILWSKWTGKKVNKDHTISWANDVKKSDKDYIIVFLNLDYLSDWGMTKKDLPEIKFK